MSNEISTTAQTESPLSEKTIDYIIRTATEGATSPEETYRKLIEATLAVSSQKPKNASITDLANSYVGSNAAFLDAFRETRSIAHNTVRKLTHEIHPDYEWAKYPNAPIRIIGVFRRGSGMGASLRSIAYDVSNGKTTATKWDTLRFEIEIGYKTWKSFDIQLGHLNGTISQHIRRTTKIQHNKVIAAEAEKIEKETKALEVKAAQLAKEHEKVAAELAAINKRNEKAAVNMEEKTLRESALRQAARDAKAAKSVA